MRAASRAREFLAQDLADLACRNGRLCGAGMLRQGVVDERLVAAFGDFNTSPKWQGNAWVNYTRGPFTGTVQLRYIGPGSFNATYTAPDSPDYDPTHPFSISNNRVDSATYVNLAAGYTFRTLGDGGSAEVFGVVDNVFNKAPPIAPGGNGRSLCSSEDDSGHRVARCPKLRV
jgi:hypothetical protein